MKTYTADEFKKLIDENPAWASTLTEKTEIIGFVDIWNNKISHLSPFLNFTHRDKNGSTATFFNCPNLKIAEGTFAGYVDFAQSGIEKIGELTIYQPDKHNTAAYFWECKELRIAEGNFPGAVNFTRSGVEAIGNLIIRQPDKSGVAADFTQCESLKVATGNFPGYVDFCESGIEKISRLIITQPSRNGDLADFSNCSNLPYLSEEWMGTEIIMDDRLRQRSETHIQKEKKGQTNPQGSARNRDLIPP